MLYVPFLLGHLLYNDVVSFWDSDPFPCLSLCLVSLSVTLCLSIRQPLPQNATHKIPNKYRGISLLNVCSKPYCYIINKRFVTWTEETVSIGEEQAGFRRDHSTTDHIFTLFAAIEKYLLRKKKLYVAVIDFEKAFGLVSYKKLWPIRLKYGLVRCILLYRVCVAL